jgi:hypothetical protein
VPETGTLRGVGGEAFLPYPIKYAKVNSFNARNKYRTTEKAPS